MKVLRWFTGGLFLMSLIYTQLSWSRPEYAIRHRINNCTGCHIAPQGGGVRNVRGKHYGARDFPAGPFSHQDWFYADVRMLDYVPQNADEGRSGPGIMAANLALNVPVTHPDKLAETRLVWEHNIGGFPGGAGGPRDTYVRWKFAEDYELTLKPKYLVVGRFHTLFGLLTDEHRTYTKIQTKSTWLDFEMGALISGDLREDIHYDWAIVNNERSGGVNLGEGYAQLWGTVFNLRWMPARWPFAVGGSASWHQRKDVEATESASGRDPYASALYAIVSLDRLTQNKFRGSVMLEYVTARYWNEAINNFVTSSDFKNAVVNSRSEGWWLQFNYDLTSRLTLIYKYDHLILNRRFPSDAYARHGLGVRYHFGPNIFAQIRAENAEAGHPTETSDKSTGEIGPLNSIWALLQISI